MLRPVQDIMELVTMCANIHIPIVTDAFKQKTYAMNDFNVNLGISAGSNHYRALPPLDEFSLDLFPSRQMTAGSILECSSIALDCPGSYPKHIQGYSDSVLINGLNFSIDFHSSFVPFCFGLPSSLY